jgi:phosphatidylserine/phosphatidylglycerophosphate/cardiolipin synthase-like enzyme
VSFTPGAACADRQCPGLGESWLLQKIVDESRLGRAVRRESRKRILEPGRNCWRMARARRAAVLVDACNYYTRLEHVLQHARKTILIVGWDFDGRIQLCPNRDGCPPLGQFLRELVEARPELDVRILVWSAAVVHASGAPMPLLVGAPWEDHPRIAVRLDQHHPLYASHHQKLVVVDDTIAFVGGIDLTVERWDTCAHSEVDRFRAGPDGASYRPVHDVQMAVDGEAARCIAEVARERWRAATGEALNAPNVQHDLWPTDLEPDFTDTSVAIARTAPAWDDSPGVSEIATLTEDLLAAARKSIYVETQYFTADCVRGLLEKSLAAKNGPEVVAVVKRAADGQLEQLVMGNNRDRLIRDLRQADQHNRLRVFYPVVAGREAACEVLVHAKVMIIDDKVLRVGSANLANRSMGLDTECDLVIEAAQGSQRRAIAGVRAQLLAEHLECSPDEIAKCIAEHGSLIRAIDVCNRNTRGLRPFTETDLDGPTEPITGTGFLDPERPLELL